MDIRPAFLAYDEVAETVQPCESAFHDPAILPQSGSAFAPIHDSRSGFSAFYRYGPRVVRDDDHAGGWPFVHHSVIRKMVFGTENYAPIMLPAEVNILIRMRLPRW